MEKTESCLTEIKTVANISMNEDVKPEPTTKRTEWSTPQKTSIKTLHDDAGWSNHAIAKEMGMAWSTVRDLLKSTGNRRDGKDRSGAPRKLTTDEVDRLVKMVTQHGWKDCIYTWEGLAKDSSLNVSVSNYIMI